MRYGSVCSGIEAATAAWHGLGWQPAWFAEIEPFPSAVLAHHYPNVENLGDMTTIAKKVLTAEVEAPDVLVGGTPCQAFSVAGMRKGLDDSRGQLTIKYVELANAVDDVRARNGKQPSIIVWENVPGVLSDKGNAFGCFLGALAGEGCELQPSGGKWTNSGCVYGPQRTIAWRILDAQYFGVAQRRRRVFLIASARKDFDPAQVLFEFDGVRRDTPPRREAGQETTGTAGSGSKGESWPADIRCNKIEQILDQEITGCLTAGFGKLGAPEIDAYTAIPWPAEIACTLNASFGDKLGLEDQHINGGAPLFVPAIAPTMGASGAPFARTGNARVEAEALVAFDCKGSQVQCSIDGTHNTLRSMNSNKSHANGGGHAAVAYGIPGNWIGRSPENGGNAVEPMHNVAPCLTVADRHGVSVSHTVRRLTPTECERLQGFPDGYTAIPWRNKPAEECPDGPRYKALGNSKAVPVVRWIGRRLEAIAATHEQ